MPFDGVERAHQMLNKFFRYDKASRLFHTAF
jgi:hypothetical protein